MSARRWTPTARLLAAAALAALVGLAGCIGSQTDDLGPSQSSSPPVEATPEPASLPSNASMADAEVLDRNATSVTFQWEGTMPPSVAGQADPVETSLTVPAGVHLAVDATLTWEEEAPRETTSLVEVRVLDASNRERCQQATIEQISDTGPEPFGPPLHCSAPLIPPLHEAGTWTVQAWGKQIQTPTPFIVELTLSLVQPAHPVGPALEAGGAGPGNLSFQDPVRVAPEVSAHEPSVDVGDDGTVYVSGYVDRPGLLWRSTDGGGSFEPIETGATLYCNPSSAGPTPSTTDPTIPTPTAEEGRFTHVGCGDVDIAAGSDGTVYWTQHYSGEAVAASHDGGDSWTTATWASNEPARTDRQWLATDGSDRAWLVFNSPRRVGPSAAVEDGIAVSRTTDGGTTWRQVGAVTSELILPGDVVYDDTEERLYLPGPTSEGPAVAVSSDGGETWDLRRVADRSGSTDLFCYVCGILVAGDVDAAGNVYVAWTDPSDGGTYDVWLASSTDGGQRWSTPVKVNSVEGTHVMPWVSAGPAGEVALAWYGTSVKGNPETIDGEWYVHAAAATDATGPEATLTETLVTEHPVQVGSICLSGGGCSGERNLGDLFEVHVDDQSGIHVAWTDGRSGGEWNDLSRVRYAKGHLAR